MSQVFKAVSWMKGTRLRLARRAGGADRRQVASNMSRWFEAQPR